MVPVGDAASRSSWTPTATATVLAADGWLTTGDFGRRTAEGNLQLSGRAHERYIRGGYNVYPAEVEEALSSHPAVARAAVVGVSDEVLGEIGVAVVVAEAGAEPELGVLRASTVPGRCPTTRLPTRWWSSTSCR